MLTPTHYTVNTELIQIACDQLPKGEMKTVINEPTGNFFYDPWVLKDEYRGTVWETLYNSLPTIKGEARVIILEPGQAYQCHADIDDRYHLNIASNKSYLIDLENNQMHCLKQDGIWYDMDAGQLHTAANFGKTDRVQLVVRKLLKKSNLNDPVTVTVKPTSAELYHARYLFDYHLSPWLNIANKNSYITDFEYYLTHVTFKIEKDRLDILKNHLPEGFVVE